MRKNRKDDICDSILDGLLTCDALLRRLSSPHRPDPTQEQCAAIRIGLQKMTMKELQAVRGLLP